MNNHYHFFFTYEEYCGNFARDTVVANTIEFIDDIETVIITGPNTGGKTVTLKTLGLIIVMAQSGIRL